jgi:hypothetical protein
MDKYRTKLLIAMQLCSIVLLSQFVGAPGSLEGWMAMSWLQAIGSRAAARINRSIPRTTSRRRVVACLT